MPYDLEINHLFFHYDGTDVLEDINLQYDKKEFLAIIGPNGGGKSTLLQLMIGLLEPSRGFVRLFGKNPSSVSHEIAYVPQNTFENKDFPITVMEVVLMGRLNPAKTFQIYSKNDREAALLSLKKVGMQGFEHHKLTTLSGGERQRVFIARALACDAKILFLDEPTASIDTAGQIAVFELLKTLNREIGIVMISHDINVALNYATKVVHVNKTLFEHDVPKPYNFQAFSASQKHVCEIELISATRCNHLHPQEKQ